MKNVLLVALLLLVPISVFTQTDTIPKTTILNANKIRAAVNSNGLLFHDLETGEGGFTHDDYPGIPLLKSVGFWAGGVDPGGNLKTAINAPDTNGRRDFLPGYINGFDFIPIDFNYIASVTRIEIETHRQDFEDNGEIDFPIAAIFSWPGAGNQHFQAYTGMELPDFTVAQSAPFYDDNQNGIYEPLQGDYPIVEIRGSCFDPPLTPDQIIWTTFHDQVDHTLSGGERVKLTVQPTIFAYDCQINEVYASTIAIRYKISYHGQEDLDSTYFGVNVDFDLGCPTDDYIGISPDNEFVYAYNATDMDTTCGDFTGLGSAPPVLLCDFVRGPLDENRNELSPLNQGMVFSQGANDNPPGTQSPEVPIEYYRYISGSWRDGSPLESGGDGYQEGTGPTNLPFIDNPNNEVGWSELTANNSSGDRNFIGSSEPFLLQPGAVNEYVVGFTVLQGVSLDTLYSQELPFHLRKYYTGFCGYDDDCGQNPTNIEEPSAPSFSAIKIYPNPATTFFNIVLDTEKTPTKLRILNLAGQELWTTNNWQSGQAIAVDWLESGVYFLEGHFEHEVVREKFVVVE